MVTLARAALSSTSDFSAIASAVLVKNPGEIRISIRWPGSVLNFCTNSLTVRSDAENIMLAIHQRLLRDGSHHGLNHVGRRAYQSRASHVVRLSTLKSRLF